LHHWSRRNCHDLWRGPFNGFRFEIRIKIWRKARTRKESARSMHVRGTCSPAATQHRRTRSTDRSEDHSTEALRVGRGGNSERSKCNESQRGKSISHVFARYSPNPRVGQAFPRCGDTFGGGVWKSNPPFDPRRAESPALKAGKITGPFSPPLL
jgi:hypothetical protein